MVEALPGVSVLAGVLPPAVLEAVLLAPPVVGVKGAVTPKPGSLELGTLAAKAAKVLSPVVGGLIAPYMPPLQCWKNGCQVTLLLPRKEATKYKTYGFSSAEEPDWISGLGHLESEDTDLSAGGIVRHEWRGEAILLSSGVELLSAGV